MIYSPDHNFLLLKNKKVGGTSLEVPLSMVVPDNAIVTPRTDYHPDWLIKDEPEYPGYRPRNYENGFYNHMPYYEIAEKIEIALARTYVFVRHPYSSVLSHFFHRLYHINKEVFNWGALTKEEQTKLVDQYFNNELGWDWYSSSLQLYFDKYGKVIIDDFLYYEKGIESEINKVLPMHGIPTIKLDIKEKAFRPTDVRPRDVFEDRHLELIQANWAWEFDNLNYVR